jgi:uncharacterized membrane protein
MKISTRLFILILLIISIITGYIATTINSVTLSAISILTCVYMIGYSIGSESKW